ncbi:hypothetical protein ACH5RR_037135 [Cinchona calisaya]|uniref:Uncharacterized protein n=1 Tax=Cinchona calisaya TaxID=153742 RepID=A0ABD2Y590_9GENT
MNMVGSAKWNEQLETHFQWDSVEALKLEMDGEGYGYDQERQQDDYIPTLCVQVNDSTVRSGVKDHASEVMEENKDIKDDCMPIEEVHKEEYVRQLEHQWRMNLLKSLRWIGLLRGI